MRQRPGVSASTRYRLIVELRVYVFTRPASRRALIIITLK